jgi:hypothetical protein
MIDDQDDTESTAKAMRKLRGIDYITISTYCLGMTFVAVGRIRA